MIISHELETKYAALKVTNEKVAIDAKNILTNFCEKNGFAFISRIKTLESLAEKLESGRFSKWSDIDDIFACTIIIPTLKDEEKVIEFCTQAFICRVKRRGSIRKPPDVFRFDGTRIYAKLKTVDESLGLQDEYHTEFEIQVKSAFEHAWSVTTHDLAYKNDEISWRRSRLAAQIKASVEQLDMLILAYENNILFIENVPWPHIERREELSTLIKKLIDDGKIPSEHRPKDVSRFSDNIITFIEKRIGEEKIPSCIKTIEEYFQSQSIEKISRSSSLFIICISAIMSKYSEMTTPKQFFLFASNNDKSLFQSINKIKSFFKI